MWQGRGLLFHRVRDLPVISLLVLGLDESCIGITTCEFWEAPVMFNHTFIGLDSHAASVVGCALNPDTGELVRMQMNSVPARGRQ